MSLEKIAIIDIGSNSMRLEILARRGSDYWLVEKQKETARISSGMYNETTITRESLERAKLALEKFSSLIAFHRADHIRCVATSAVRDAKNQADVLELLGSNLPYKIEVLSGEEEAFYSYFGVKTALTSTMVLYSMWVEAAPSASASERVRWTPSAPFPWGPSD